MARTSRLIVFFLPCLFLALLLPRPLPGGDDWQPISPEDLAMKDNPASPGAHAMILYRESFDNGEKSYVMVYRRIKVFTEEGKKYADIEIPFVPGQYEVKDLRARTIEPDGRIVDFNGKTFDKLVVKAGGFRILEKTFSLPEIQPGCIIEFRYRLQLNPSFYWSTRWDIQDTLFTRREIFSVKPFAGSMGLFWRPFRVSQDVKLEKQKDGSYGLELHNIPGLGEEDYMLPEEELKARIDFFYRDHGVETNEQFWKRVVKGWNEGFENFVNKKGALQKAIEQTVSPSDPSETKLRKLYARAQQIRNLGDERSKTAQEEKREKLKDNENVEDVLKHGYANGRDINQLFVALARTAGFQAAIAWVAPRHLRFFHPELQDTEQINFDVVNVRLDSQDLYLDPSCSLCPFGLLPWYEGQAKGIRLDKDGGTFITTTALWSADARIESKTDLALAVDGTLEGKLQADFFGQKALGQRYEARDEDDAGRRKQITDLIRGWFPAGSSFDITTCTGWEGSPHPLHIEGTVRLPGFALAAGRRLLLPLGILDAGRHAPFQHAQRTHAVYFSYPYQNQEEITVRLPAGYRVETLPPPKQMPLGKGTYSLTAKQDGDVLRIVRQETIEDTFFPVESYPTLHSFFAGMKASDEQQAILQSADSAKQN
jgi:hypothetical protein